MSNLAEAPSQLESTNAVLVLLANFVLNGNSILTWIHVLVLFLGGWLFFTVSRFDVSRLGKHCACPEFAKDMAQFIKGRVESSIAVFAISFVLFLLGVALGYVPDVPSLAVQVLTYIPTVVFAVTQLAALKGAFNLVMKQAGN